MRSILFLSISLFVLFMACEKSNRISTPEIVAVNVVHAVIDLPAIKIDQSNGRVNFSSLFSQLSFGTGALHYFRMGESRVSILRQPDSVIILNTALNLSKRMNSLFIVGGGSTPDTVLHEELDFPFVISDPYQSSINDSVIYVRFANLSPDSLPLMVTLATSPTVTESIPLHYKDITNFKAYPAGLGGPASYTFQVRSALDSSMLTSVRLSITSTNRFKCVAVIIRGRSEGVPPYNLAASVINYY